MLFKSFFAFRGKSGCDFLGQMRLAIATGAAHFLLRGRPYYMDCARSVLRQLEALEPVYRMRFGPAINGGSRASVCEKWLYAFLKTSKYWNLRDRFRPSEPCAACGRPVYNLKGWKVTSVFCSSSCADLSGFRRKPSRVKLQNPITSSFTRCFSGTIIACQSAMGLDLHPAGIESAAV